MELCRKPEIPQVQFLGKVVAAPVVVQTTGAVVDVAVIVQRQVPAVLRDIWRSSDSFIDGVFRARLSEFFETFSDSVVESPFCADFLGALDGQQLLVIESSRCQFISAI